MKRCFLFPGQGAQYPGMGKDLYDISAAARELVSQASEITGLDMKALLFEGTEAELAQTDKTQIAVTTVNLAVLAALRERGIVSEGAAGFSLGEFSALVDAGVLRQQEALALVFARGKAMQKASRNADGPEGPAGMAAVIGAGFDDLSGAIRDIPNVFIANYNAPTQLVLSGTARALAMAEDACKGLGRVRFVRLKVSGPFHCPLLSEAAELFAVEAGKCDFRDPVKPVFSNVTGAPIPSGNAARDLAVRQITNPVLWVREEEAIRAAGFEQCLETGPGTVLSGLWKTVEKTIPCLPAGTAAQIESVAP